MGIGKERKKYSDIIAVVCLIILVIVIAVAYSTGYVATISDNELIIIQEAE